MPNPTGSKKLSRRTGSERRRGKRPPVDFRDFTFAKDLMLAVMLKRSRKRQKV
jgi:hypothetical protein